MKLRSLDQAELEGKTVLYRSPYDINVNTDGTLVDESRIAATIPTLKYLLEHNTKIVVLTFVGRPDGKVVENMRTTVHAQVLARLLGTPVTKLDECVGDAVRSHIAGMSSGQIVMLENTRFHAEDTADDDAFAQELAKNGDVVVFDAFPQAHRTHSSVTGIMRHLPSYAGLYLIDEVNKLSGLLEQPKRPLVVIIGGAKVSDKVDAINNLYSIADKFLVGGGVANVFLKASGAQIGSSYIEDVFVDENKKAKKDWVEYAREILAKGPDKIIMPSDAAVASVDATQTAVSIQFVDPANPISEGQGIYDIGPATIAHYTQEIAAAATIFWNGPVGKFEDTRFAEGTKAVAQAMAENTGLTVIGGGDTIAAVDQYSDPKLFSHISLAGGATLEFLAGKKLPALEMLQTV